MNQETEQNPMSRMNQKSVLLAVAVSGLLTACSTPRNVAPVVERSPSVYTGARPADGSRAGDAARASVGPGYYLVKRGDSLLRIAQQSNQNLRDLVVWNNLANANDIKVDQVLRVVPPDAGGATYGTPPGAGEGAQTSSIATGSGVEVRPLNVPAGPSVGAGGAAMQAQGSSAGAVHKSGPRGEKRAYTENTLEEMQRGEAVASAPAAAIARAPEKAVEKPAERNDRTEPADNAAAEGGAWGWPAEGRLTGTFSSGKKGIDIAGKAGQPVLAASAGTVLYASSVRGYGNLVIIKHSTNLLSAYAHNRSILVKEGQTVRKGQKIAEMGNSDTDAVKLHFEVRQQGKPVDPAKFLPAR